HDSIAVHIAEDGRRRRGGGRPGGSRCRGGRRGRYGPRGRRRRAGTEVTRGLRRVAGGARAGEVEAVREHDVARAGQAEGAAAGRIARGRVAERLGRPVVVPVRDAVDVVARKTRVPGGWIRGRKDARGRSPAHHAARGRESARRRVVPDGVWRDARGGEERCPVGALHDPAGTGGAVWHAGLRGRRSSEVVDQNLEAAAVGLTFEHGEARVTDVVLAGE